MTFSGSSSCAYPQKPQKLLICVDTQIPNSGAELFCVQSQKLHREVVFAYPQNLQKVFICVHMQKLRPVRGAILRTSTQTSQRRNLRISTETPENSHCRTYAETPPCAWSGFAYVQTLGNSTERNVRIYAHGSNMEFLRIYAEFLSFLILEILRTYAELLCTAIIVLRIDV